MVIIKYLHLGNIKVCKDKNTFDLKVELIL